MIKRSLAHGAAMILLAAALPTFAAELPATESSAAPTLTPTQLASLAKQVTDSLGLQFDGYLRSGFYDGSGSNHKQQYQLGGDLQHYRLGNEGDTYLEFGVGKQWDAGDGVKWGVYAMPSWYNGTQSTKQLYGTLSGLPFAPQATLWAGQRYHRIQDIHIVDNWLMQDGDNYGAGIDNLAVGAASLNLALYSSGSYDNNNTTIDNARRFNFQLTRIPVNSGGTLSLTGALVHGDFAIGKSGGALGLLHSQKDFLHSGLNNSLFLQASTGHAALTGEFYNLDNNGAAQEGARQQRIAEVLNWQVGRFGGQALASYQRVAPDIAAAWRDSSVGGRVSYGLSQHVKLLAEAGLTARAIDNQPTQHLNKVTLAVALSPDTAFWTRPEIRLYASRFNWNDAAASANAGTFGADGQTHANTVGIQLETWW
ncbi:carbohydrate porin [Paludibacterium purpuratum]|uniref:Maltoporin n=1 Tax=Paludibacterium purpuratum TaxID=1144873 RepID=A0A4R7B792_9NEIS|nr:carbohydrate porin [Paludibacterium purpuratum]TDR80624.1 maltoporin [Paludibacterium purpuratum]